MVCCATQSFVRQQRRDQLTISPFCSRLVLCLTFFEFLLSMKNFKRRSAFDTDQLRFDSEIVAAWASTAGLLLLATFLKAARLRRGGSEEAIRVIAYLTPIPLLLLLAQDAWRSFAFPSDSRGVEGYHDVRGGRNVVDL